MRRLCAFVAALLMCAGVAEAQEKIKVGVLKLSSSAVLFAGVEKGFFKDYGIDPELVYFQAAAPIATALAAGQIDVGATGLTAALYNIVLGGEKLWIVADKGREWPGYPLTALIVQKDLWEGGLKSIGDLKGKRIGVTQLGSTFHYHLGNVLEKHGLTLNDVKIVPLQAMGTALEALKGKQVEAIALAQPFPARAEAEGFGKVLAWGGDLFPWQTATIFYSHKFAADKTKAVNFMKGYVKASRYYFDNVLVQKDGRLAPGPHYDEVLAITAKYTGASPAVVRVGFPYQDRNGRLWVADVEKQMVWWQKHGFTKSVIPLKQIVDSTFLEAAVRAVGE